MTAVAQMQGNHTLRVRVPAEATAVSDDTWVLGMVPQCTITGVTWIPDAAVTGAATNNFSLAVQNATNSSTAITTTKTYALGTNSVAATAETLTLSATAANLNCSANDVLVLARVHNSSGLASPAGTIEVTYKLR